MSWVGYAGTVAGCIVVSEVGKVQINNYFQAHLPHTTYKELIAAGVVALYNLIKSSKEAPSGERPLLRHSSVIVFCSFVQQHWRGAMASYHRARGFQSAVVGVARPRN